MSTTHTWMRNAETNGLWECPNDAVAVMATRGWEETDAPDYSLEGLFDAPPTPPPPAADIVPPQTHFDPADHNVDEVVAELEKYRHDAPGEVVRILEMERAGKQRKTILTAMDAEPEPDSTPTGD